MQYGIRRELTFIQVRSTGNGGIEVRWIVGFGAGQECFLIRTIDPFSRGSDSGIYFMRELNGDMQNISDLENIYLWDGMTLVLTEQWLLYEE